MTGFSEPHTRILGSSLSTPSKTGFRIGVDLGGTKIEAVCLDGAGESVLRRRIPTPSGDYQAIITAIVNLVAAIEQELGNTASVGIGMPGTLSSATGLVKNSNSVCLNGARFDQDLMAALGRPVRFSNDANCFALSEALDGAAAGAAVVFGVILGTGTGGGVVVNGQVIGGPNSIAGEWGHNPLPWPHSDETPGPPCYCGKTGCIETWLSGTGFVADFRRVGGAALQAPEIVSLAAAGDRLAGISLSRYEDRMARGLASIINVLDPDSVVLGGGMSNVLSLYHNVPKLWVKYIFSDVVKTSLVRAKYGDASGVRGAAWLWD